MKIYTKTGDKGETSLFGGERVPKDAPRVDAYGTVDELNSILGIVQSEGPDWRIQEILTLVQNQLFTLGADLATPGSGEGKSVNRTGSREIDALERAIDAIDPLLKPLKSFILPGGSPTASRLHCARTVCRRAERAVVRLSRSEDVSEGAVIYLNRLSDLLFTLARYANHVAGVQETQWKS